MDVMEFTILYRFFHALYPDILTTEYLLTTIPGTGLIPKGRDIDKNKKIPDKHKMTVSAGMDILSRYQFL